ncbi:hypothetical protein J3R83DRAFT_5550 [Lanmaoa asiatica]|nr:hypothetical protein J3R83DRAFT_5550 [Lanmaoa asiatica]
MYYKSLFPPLPQVPPQNAHNIFFKRPDQADWPDYPLHVNALTGATRSFRQFLEIVRDGATAMGSDVKLGGLGIRAKNDELVGLLSENSMDYIALLHSLLVMTIPFALFSSYSTPFEFQHTFKLASPTRLFVSPTLLPLALSSGLPEDRIYILEGDVQGRTSYGDLVARARSMPRLPIQQAQSDTLAYLAFSSGTSGLPKAVMISHGNLIDSLCQMLVVASEVLKVHGVRISFLSYASSNRSIHTPQKPPVWNGPGGTNVTFNVLPIHHAYGLHITTFRSFIAPSTLVLIPKWNAEVYFDSITKYRVTSIFLVPSLVHQIVHHPKFPTIDFSKVQTINCGAAYLPVSLAEKLRSRFPSVERVNEGGSIMTLLSYSSAEWISGYGMSECTLSISLKPPPGILEGRAKNVPGSVGMLLPGVDARVVREDGRLASVNEPGELHVRSGSVALGYWKNQRATDETFKAGWLRTGDRIRIDADGVLYFEDRAKDTLKVSGMQVSPTEIEETLLRQPDNLIIDVTVAGVSGGRTADERLPRAWVVLSPNGRTLGATEVTARLDAWVRETLSRYKWLRGGIAVVNQVSSPI